MRESWTKINADWSVCFRTGGNENFQWTIVPANSERHARIMQAENIIAGRMAYVYDALAVRLGAPDTYGNDVSPLDIRNARVTLSNMGIK